MREIGAEIKLLHQGLTEQKIVLDAEANQFQITQNQKFAMLEAETQKEYEAELSLLQQEAALGDLSVKQRLNVINQIAALEEKHRIDMIKLDEQAIAQQQQIWTTSLGTIENAFNSQLRGILAGTTSWSQAFKNILGDIIIKFIEMCETMVVKWLAAELAQTTATTSGAAARAAAEQGAREFRHSRQCGERAAGDHGRRGANFRRRVRLSGADHGAGGGWSGRGGASLRVGGGDFRRRHRLCGARRPGADPSRRNDHPGGARLRTIHRRRLGPQIHAPVSISVSALDSPERRSVL